LVFAGVERRCAAGGGRRWSVVGVAVVVVTIIVAVVMVTMVAMAVLIVASPAIACHSDADMMVTCAADRRDLPSLPRRCVGE
jgi:hypothetical protein